MNVPQDVITGTKLTNLKPNMLPLIVGGRAAAV